MLTSAPDISAVLEGLLVPTTDPTIVFPSGLVGYERWKRFVLLTEEAEDLPVAILQSIDDREVQLLVANPYALDPAFRARLTEGDRAELELDAGEDPTLLCTLTLQQDGWLTANLVGPLAINPRTRRAKQLVLSDACYTTRHPVARVESEAA